MSISFNPRGSAWHRWDPHLHAPGTLLSDQFGGDWDSYLRSVENTEPRVRALGVTDYYCIQTYREVCKRKAQGRLSQVEFLFPNVEMRLDVKTGRGKGVNIHLLFSPEDPSHKTEIERLLGHLTFEFRERTYKCTISDFEALGRVFDPRQTDERGAIRVGANQFKISLTELKNLFRKEAWLRHNCLVAVAGGRGDGTAGLQDDAFAAMRREIETFAHIVFSATPSQREYWLGRKSIADRGHIERTYGALKPCLHGSDAHRGDKVAAPDQDRYCWLKGDLCFETLRQVVIEPEERVWQGDSAPDVGNLPGSVSDVTVSGAPWFLNGVVELNHGLVAIIGSRGSGKTALVDVIASGAGAMGAKPAESSFLRRATSPTDHIGEARVELTWGDGTTSDAALRTGSAEFDLRIHYPEARYLSQQFVEQLCSSAGLATELRQEMERVVFDALDPVERQETGSFDDLISELLEPVRRRRAELQTSIDIFAEKIADEEDLHERLSGLQKEHKDLTAKIEKVRQEVGSLLRKGKEQRAERLVHLEEACGRVEAKLEGLKLRLRILNDLEGEVAHARNVTEPSRFGEMRERFSRAGISDSDWGAFEMRFVGDVAGILRRAKRGVSAEIALALDGDPASPVDMKEVAPDRWPLSMLKTERESLKKEVGIDAQQQRRYGQLHRSIANHESALRKLTEGIERAIGAWARRQQFIESRRATYVQVFDTFAEEEKILGNLYSPLRGRLQSGSGALSRLEFVVRRKIDLDRWVEDGEELLDLRNATRFRGHGSLRRNVEKDLLPPWANGNATDVERAMDLFRSESQDDLRKARPPSVGPEDRRAWANRVASWLYKTSHITIEYGIQYDGVEIEQLSPGTRGIVLLLLYLAVDQVDRRPLIIDQPEENLDPNTVFQELVPHFREARKRRQLIVVTHNANLVVNTDADQVVIASSKLDSGETLPAISYKSGSVENPEIRGLVCKILEGGERAFLERERRYRLRWDTGLETQNDRLRPINVQSNEHDR